MDAKQALELTIEQMSHDNITGNKNVSQISRPRQSGILRYSFNLQGLGSYCFSVDHNNKISFDGIVKAFPPYQGRGTRLVKFGEDLCSRLGVELMLINEAEAEWFWHRPSLGYKELDKSRIGILRIAYPQMRYTTPMYKELSPFDWGIFRQRNDILPDNYSLTQTKPIPSSAKSAYN